MRSFTAAGQACSGREFAGVRQLGDLADVGAVAQITVGVDRGDPVGGLTDCCLTGSLIPA